ncbi:MAG: bifunctional UDP-N-acetylmuramoyl-tripeptide:D-alanyl-D-alanine ligase/alanine racemase [Bacteroidota bacterium]|nr:bifunctional UDP-N-acetylmuramoyl-tripeptide:D-alanyl-D-alanine ligase/alanine racemase [Bacteroidota bacterium]
MKYHVSKIAKICHAKLLGDVDLYVEHLLTDSRSITQSRNTMFFALSGYHHDGHEFVESLYQAGVRVFVVKKKPIIIHPDAAYLLANDVLKALQAVAKDYRCQFDLPVVAITGSNGKTIVKEWINQIASPYHYIVRSPKSYNSQIGVPLSVVLLNKQADFAIFEAGISQKGEMKALQDIINPDIGVFTGLGAAHQENFDSSEEKLREKLLLFKSCKTIIAPADTPNFKTTLNDLFPEKSDALITWSFDNEADYQCTQQGFDSETKIRLESRNELVEFSIPFTDRASIHNAISTYIIARSMDMKKEQIIPRMSLLEPVAMRLEVLEGINNCKIINDTYNSDVNALQIALDFASKQAGKLIVILSDIVQSGRPEKEFCQEVSDMLIHDDIQLIGIGEHISANRLFFDSGARFFQSTAEFLDSRLYLDFKDAVVLLKGARKFKFEEITRVLEKKLHQTVLEVDLNAMRKNLGYFRSLLPETTRIMVMVKAFSYGSGYVEVAKLLQEQSVDYLGVAFADEGVELRKAGISLPIIVMNPENSAFDLMLNYNLQFEIYSLSQLRALLTRMKNRAAESIQIHIKLDTGMHRLGFQTNEIQELLSLLDDKVIHVSSVFSHLAASDSPEEDEFTALQLQRFHDMYEEISLVCETPPIRHIANTHGIIRHPETHLDMVRLGIGLYGYSSQDNNFLKTVIRLKTRVLDVKALKSGGTVGYNRSGKLLRDSEIAILPIGYADGIRRRLGNGNWEVFIAGKMYPIIGDICMDMCMVDVTGAKVNPGDEVVLFGDKPSAKTMADKLETIVYEVFTGIPPRVKRIYTSES